MLLLLSFLDKAFNFKCKHMIPRIHAHWGLCVGCVNQRTVNESWIRKARIVHLDTYLNTKQAHVQ